MPLLDSVALATSEEPTEEQPAEKSEEEALDEVLGKLTEAGALDQGEKQELMANLREAKQENWPMIVRQFQAALAYREQLLARDEKAAAEKLAAETASPKTVSPKTTEIVAAKPATRPTAVPVSFDRPQAEPRQSPRQSPLASVTVLPEPPVVLTKPPRPQAPVVSLVSTGLPPQQLPQLAHDWHVPLQNAIRNLETSVQPSPGSTGEVNQHMRLRLLQLLAGNEEASLQPIPGASAPQQDYWNKQLFAVSTFLDSSQQPDNRRRAANSLMHLDGARAKLAEMATLQVRNLSFVDSVEGYGAYELHEEAKFRPGDQITLYAEIENFSSESTQKGYQTRLGTSYEVVDKNGKRVDSAQFPEVEDLCHNPRRDFHMQYTVTLPTRIYPDQYEIRLIVTDQQSHKIGQASVPFEIVE